MVHFVGLDVSVKGNVGVRGEARAPCGVITRSTKGVSMR